MSMRTIRFRMAAASTYSILSFQPGPNRSIRIAWFGECSAFIQRPCTYLPRIFARYSRSSVRLTKLSTSVLFLRAIWATALTIRAFVLKNRISSRTSGSLSAPYSAPTKRAKTKAKLISTVDHRAHSVPIAWAKSGHSSRVAISISTPSGNFTAWQLAPYTSVAFRRRASSLWQSAGRPCSRARQTDTLVRRGSGRDA